MARKCFMCGGEIAEGILCDTCDKPRRRSSDQGRVSAGTGALESTPSGPSGVPASREATAPEIEQFPKAPVVPFPLESASPAITSVVNLLAAAGVASLLVGADRKVKFASDEAKKLFDATASELSSLEIVETKSGIRITDLSVPGTAGVRIGSRNFIYSLVPMSGGASGAVLMFRPADPTGDVHASFVSYVRETIFEPLRGLHESMRAAAAARHDHFLDDSAAVLDQVLSALDLAPEIGQSTGSARPVPTVTDVVRRVAERFVAHAGIKGVRVDVDVQDLSERFTDHDALADALTILMENAFHYVPAGGQVVIGVRWMEHKGKPLLLFFVMDNGPVVPEEMRQIVFEPSFVWDPAVPERTGRGLFKCREFAVAHAGSIWVESKTGKACTFFLRVRPDGIR